MISTFTREEDAPAGFGFSLPLTEEVADPSVIGFYSFIGGQWQHVADVTLTPDERAEGEFTSVPPNLVVLREVRE